MNDDLNIDIDSVLGLGRVALNFKMREDKSVTLPQLHFILYRDTGPKGEDIISGICVEFGLFYSHADHECTFHGLRKMCIDFLEKNKGKNANQEEIEDIFLKLVSDRKLENLWELYRKANYRTALRGFPTVDVLKIGFIAQLEAEIDRLKAKVKYLESKQDVDMPDAKNTEEKRVFTENLSLVPSVN